MSFLTDSSGIFFAMQYRSLVDGADHRVDRAVRGASAENAVVEIAFARQELRRAIEILRCLQTGFEEQKNSKEKPATD